MNCILDLYLKNLILAGNMKRTSLYLIGTALIFLLSCGKQMFTLTIKENKSDKLKLNGFYYNKIKKDYFILYESGIMYNGGGPYFSISHIHNLLNDSLVRKRAIKLPYCWGVYNIRNDSIFFERWRSGDSGGGYPVISYNGKIKDTSTIIIRDNRKHKEARPLTYSFYPYHIKPDSINNPIFQK
jgi:hypothetical protein